ncbi:ribonuclease T2 [Pararhizobium capsulatum DSM 1112]|uniref:Ribonuclease T2 n=1 Tax=Pararhizobium capsulatum DSM 1112 TaxID=1121113 RepID=A0ABU0BNH5_9HYPH|nr:ribonuclease [Pararhizobium capsulatum]MDQ0319804.1 ribonuclease T2 [Pararhizobium capsulatum DSM 1112]
MRSPAKTLAAAVMALALTGCGESGEDGAKNGQTAKVPTPIASTSTAKKPEKTTAAVPVGTGFDFYVLSLSWSPSWCGENDPQGKTRQCDTARSHGLIVHGLWPQNDSGYEFCRSRDSDRVPETLGRQFLDIIPSMGLIGHEWRKHGTCSGLSQRDYFAVMRAAWNKLKLPPALKSGATASRSSPTEIEASLVSANPGMTAGGVAVTCQSGQLEEIRICLDHNLGFRSCPEIDRGGCRARSLTLPAL